MGWSVSRSQIWMFSATNISIILQNSPTESPTPNPKDLHPYFQLCLSFFTCPNYQAFVSQIPLTLVSSQSRHCQGAALVETLNGPRCVLWGPADIHYVYKDLSHLNIVGLVNYVNIKNEFSPLLHGPKWFFKHVHWIRLTCPYVLPPTCPAPETQGHNIWPLPLQGGLAPSDPV